MAQLDVFSARRNRYNQVHELDGILPPKKNPYAKNGSIGFRNWSHQSLPATISEADLVCRDCGWAGSRQGANRPVVPSPIGGIATRRSDLKSDACHDRRVFNGR